MFSMLDQYDGSPDYRKFLIDLPDLDLQGEVDETGNLTDNVISKILRVADTNIHQASLSENKVELKFILHKSTVTVDDLQRVVRSLGSAVGQNSYNLSNITVTEL